MRIRPLKALYIGQTVTPNRFGFGGAIRTEKRKDGEIVDINLIFKIAAIGVIVAVINQLLVRAGREEQALMTTLAGLVVVLFMLIEQISALFETIKSVFGL